MKVCRWVAGWHGADPPRLACCSGQAPALSLGPLTVSLLGGTRPDRSAARSCSCLPTERRERALAGAEVGGVGVPTADREPPGQMDRQIHRTRPRPQSAVFCFRGPAEGRVHWEAPSKVGRAGEGLGRVQRGLGRPAASFCHRQKLKRGLTPHLCVSVNTLGLRPPPG